VRPYQSIISNGKHLPDAKAQHLLEYFGSGFREVDHLLTVDARKAIQKGKEATVALDHYHRHGSGYPRLADVVLAANEAQRAFLELRAKSNSDLQQVMCRCIRIAALVSLALRMPLFLR
jgi:hypothetical protein